MATGTFRSLARVLTMCVLPDPDGPTSNVRFLDLYATRIVFVDAFVVVIDGN